MSQTSSQPLKNPLCVALDVDHADKALQLVKQLSPLVGGFKLGPRLLLRFGSSLVQEISKVSPVFVDCKFFDIPSTMESSVRACFESGASLVTVHAASGKEALEKMAELECELNKQRPFRILAVTVLTSWNQDSFPPNLISMPVADHVVKLATFVKSCGLNSIVCSPEEIGLLKDKNLYLLTPGIRFATDNKGDQKRVMSPQQALDSGASALVVGRPILEASDPIAVVKKILNSEV